MNNQNLPAMTSVAPYMLRALVQWIVDNDQTPHILVDTTVAKTEVPKNYIQPDGRIVLNISIRATEHLSINDDFVSFSARFNGRAQQVFVPISAIISVFAKESGTGMCLSPMHRQGTQEDTPVEAKASPSSSSPESNVKRETSSENPKPGSAADRAAQRWGNRT